MRSAADAEGISTRLRERRGELEETAFTRVRAIADPSEVIDTEYAAGLRVAVSAAVDYGLSAIACGHGAPPPIPVSLLSQARLAARNGVPLETVLRRYMAGYAMLSDFVIDELEGADGVGPMRDLLHNQAVRFDALIGAVSAEYEREMGVRRRDGERRDVAQVRRLLNGEARDAGDLAYDLDTWHVALVLSGPCPVSWPRELARTVNCALLFVRPGDDLAWIWLGARTRPAVDELQWLVEGRPQMEVRVAIGEPSRGIGGWRLSHRQARAASSLARLRPARFARYREAAALISMLQDDLLLESLRELYRRPLDEQRDGGATARRTLRAYFGADCNVSSAAAALGVNRHTVGNRIRALEERFGRPLSACRTELDAVLRIEELEHPVRPPGKTSD